MKKNSKYIYKLISSFSSKNNMPYFIGNDLILFDIKYQEGRAKCIFSVKIKDINKIKNKYQLIFEVLKEVSPVACYINYFNKYSYWNSIGFGYYRDCYFKIVEGKKYKFFAQESLNKYLGTTLSKRNYKIIFDFFYYELNYKYPLKIIKKFIKLNYDIKYLKEKIKEKIKYD